MPGIEGDNGRGLDIGSARKWQPRSGSQRRAQRV